MAATKNGTDLRYYHNANNLVVDTIKHETSGVLIKDFVGIKSKV